MAVFNKNRKTPTTQQQYVDSLDPLLRKNTGSFVNQGYDTSSNTPYFLPNTRQVQQPQGLEGGLRLDQMQTPQTDYTVQYPQAMQLPTQPQQGKQRMDASTFLKEISRPREPEAVEMLPDGGIYFSNGIIKYEDGTERSGNPQAYAVSSMFDGVGYSDGSVRRVSPTLIRDLGNGRAIYSDGTVRYFSPVEGQGMDALQTGLFGKVNTITQAYGNRNASLYPTTGMHRGLDIRTNNEQLTAPFRGTVVQRFYDDNTRFGTQSGHKGYGNSVLIQLDTGEMLRFSHLSESDLNVGDVIDAGTVIGVTGSTGNSTGPHLDLEYYDANGRINDPDNFSMLKEGGMQQAGAVVKEEELSDNERQAVQNYKDYRPQQRQSNEEQTPFADRQYQSRPQAIEEPQMQPQYPEFKVAGDLSDKVGNWGAERGLPDAGVSEFVDQIGRGAGKVVHDTSVGMESGASQLGLPEAYIGEIMRGTKDVGVSELASGNFREGGEKASNWIESAGKNAGVPNRGVGEGVRSVTQLAQNFRDNPQKQISGMILGAQDIAQNMNPFNPKDAYADDSFRSNEPIGQKVNKSLLEGNILSALEGLKSTFNIKGINPQGIANNALNAGQGVASGIMDAGSQAVNAFGEVANRAKNVIVDTFDGEEEDSGDESTGSSNLSGYQSVAPTTAVFKKTASTPSNSSSSSSKSSSSKSSSSSSKPTVKSQPISTKPIVIVQKKSTPSPIKVSPANQSTKSILQSGKLPMSSSTNPKAANYKPAPAPKPAPVKTSVFKKVTNIIKSIFKR